MELCEALGLVDFTRAVKLSGSGFVLYTNWGAKLERALIQFMLDLHTSEHGYTEVSPPFMVGPQCLEGVGQFPKFADQYYAVQEGLDASTLGKLYLIPTAETPVANIHREEILKESELPIRYCAYTPCFRGEAGAAGVGTRGMIRVHQFDKVELIQIVKPEDGYAEHEKMVGHAERVLQNAGLALSRGAALHGRHGLREREDLRPGSVGARAGELPGGFERVELRGFPGAADEPAVQGGRAENKFPHHLLTGAGRRWLGCLWRVVETYQQEDGSLVIAGGTCNLTLGQSGFTDVMRILLASSEVHPYSKTGGLADMVGALAKTLARAGHRVGVVTPLYAGIRERFPRMQAAVDLPLEFPLGARQVSGAGLEPWNRSRG